MYAYSTPTHDFYLCIDPRLWVKFIITYTQHDAIILEKNETDDYEIKECEDGGYLLSLKLSQDETSLFNPKEKAAVQIRCLYDNGDTFPSNKIVFEVKDVFNKTIMEG